MTRQFPADPDVAFTSLQTVDGADVVQTAAGHIVARGGVCAGHHPGGAQGNGVDLGEKADASDIRSVKVRIECESTPTGLEPASVSSWDGGQTGKVHPL